MVSKGRVVSNKGFRTASVTRYVTHTDTMTAMPVALYLGEHIITAAITNHSRPAVTESDTKTMTESDTGDEIP
jgi:hypothetical protein